MRRSLRRSNGMIWGAMGFVLSVAFIVPAYAGEKEQRPPKDIAEAEKWFQKPEEAAGGRNFHFDTDKGFVTYESRNGTTTIPFVVVARVGTVVLEPVGNTNGWHVHWTLEGDSTDWWISNASRSEIDEFRAGLIYLAKDAVQKLDASAQAALDRFTPKAEAWRTLTEKPKMPESAYSHKVLAENAYKEKDLGKALSEYELALRDFPTWPEGQFNAALIAAELGHYRIAVHFMQEYLLLEPDAPDAQAAKDKVIIWRDKIPSL